MKRISNITQTYGNERLEEIDNFLSEQNIKALNMLDIVSFSFHNSRNDFKKYAKDKILQKIPKCIFFEFNDIPYTESIIKYLENLKKLGCTDFMLWQDDHYLNYYNNTFDIYKEIYNFYKNNNIITYFKAFGICYHIICNNIIVSNKYNIKDNIYIYETYTNEFRKSGYWAYTDENYFMNIDIARKLFFTDNNKNLDVCELEKHLKVVSESNKISICLTNAYLFERCGIHGPNQREYSSSDKISMLRAKKYNSNLLIENKIEESIKSITKPIIKEEVKSITKQIIKVESSIKKEEIKEMNLFDNIKKIFKIK